MPLTASKKDAYTYGDYLEWPEEERWELIEGKPYAMTPAPSRRHQRAVGELFYQIRHFLSEQKCEVYMAPFDVRLPEAEEEDRDIATVVQPDIAVICDPDKLDDQGCRGGPDLIIEILSPSTAAKDSIEKVALYEKHGTKEYWIIDPVHNLVTVRRLGEDGRYSPPVITEGKEGLEVSALPGLKIDLNAVLRRQEE